MSRRSRRAQRRRRKDMLGVGLMALAVLVVGGVGLAAATLRTPPFDPDTLCRSDAKPPAHTLVLVDATDALDVRHLRRLKTIVRGTRRSCSGEIRTIRSLPGKAIGRPSAR